VELRVGGMVISKKGITRYKEEKQICFQLH